MSQPTVRGPISLTRHDPDSVRLLPSGAPHPVSNADVIRRLYQGLADLDGAAMTACHTADARFEDPAFGVLAGSQVGGMWRMLTSRSLGIEVDLSDVRSVGDEASARWVARYQFGPKRRLVENRIAARFRFAEGLISDHVDTFSFHAWARQALPGGAHPGLDSPVAEPGQETRTTEPGTIPGGVGKR